MPGTGNREIDRKSNLQVFMKSTSTFDNVLCPVTHLVKYSVFWMRLSTSPVLHTAEVLESIAVVLG